MRRLRLDRAGWQARREDSAAGLGEVVIEGLEHCLPMFGLTA